LFIKLDASGICSNCQIKNKEAEARLVARLAFLKQQEEKALAAIAAIPRVEIKISDIKIKNRALSELANIKYSNITPKGTYEEFVVIDTETTGIAPSKDKIIELSAVRFVDEKPVSMFTTLVNPQCPIPKGATIMNHISDEMVAKAPTIHQVMPAFDEFIGKSNIVGHNLEFDLKFIHKNGSSIIDTKRKYFCTMKQAQKLLKKPKRKWDPEYEMYEIDYDSDYDVEDHKLGTLCDYFNICIPEHHRAYVDAYCTGLLFLALIDLKQNG